jgi:hypothetical protein
MTILYERPPLLQILLFGLALSIWMMLYTLMSERQADPQQRNPADEEQDSYL